MTTVDVEHLNNAEKRVLRLLAEGHTIKSAAMLIGSTTSAVNERLREARGKTGAGSSRELARELKAQENRDNRIGVDGHRGAPSLSDRSGAAQFGRRWKGWIVMILGFGAVAAAIALFSNPSMDLPNEPLIGSAMPDEPTPAEWQQRLRSEERDQKWASEAEQVLRHRYAQVGNVGTPGGELRVTCARTVCEVAGLLAPSGDRLDATVRDLQGSDLFADLLARGLKSQGSLFTSSRAEPGRAAFFTYFTKVDT